MLQINLVRKVLVLQSQNAQQSSVWLNHVHLYMSSEHLLTDRGGTFAPCESSLTEALQNLLDLLTSMS